MRPVPSDYTAKLNSSFGFGEWRQSNVPRVPFAAGPTPKITGPLNLRPRRSAPHPEGSRSVNVGSALVAELISFGKSAKKLPLGANARHPRSLLSADALLQLRHLRAMSAQHRQLSGREVADIRIF